MPPVLEAQSLNHCFLSSQAQLPLLSSQIWGSRTISNCSFTCLKTPLLVSSGFQQREWGLEGKREPVFLSWGSFSFGSYWLNVKIS